MSNCRTFNRSRKEQQQKKPRGAAMILVSNLAYKRIEADPQKFVDKLFYMLEVKDSINAAGLIVKLADGAEIVAVEETELRRPTAIEKWTGDLDREAQEKAAKEAAAAQEAAGRELGQIPEPDPSPKEELRAQPIAQTAGNPARETKAQQHGSNIGNTWVNEIGLPARGFSPAGQSQTHTQTTDSQGSRSCRSHLRFGPAFAPSANEPAHESGNESGQAVLNPPGTAVYA